MGYLSDARHATVTAMGAYQYSMKCHTNNLAHAGLKRTKDHNYTRQIPILTTNFDSNNKLHINKKVKLDKNRPFTYEYKPGDPDADEKGFVEVQNINPLLEMTDIVNMKHSNINCLKIYELIIDSERRTNNLLA